MAADRQSERNADFPAATAAHGVCHAWRPRYCRLFFLFHETDIRGREWGHRLQTSQVRVEIGEVFWGEPIKEAGRHERRCYFVPCIDLV